jgi:hypothetical protein
MPLFYVAFETLRQIRSQRHDAGLAELRISDQQSVLSKVGIGQLEMHHFSDSQAQTVEQSENCLVNKTSMPRPRSFRKTSRHCEQPLSGGEIEQVWDTGAGDTARCRLDRTALYPLLHRREGEKAP